MITVDKLFNITNQVIDISYNSTMLVEPAKSLETGVIKKHFRFANDFFIVESVLHGFKKKFLDSVRIFTSSGCLIKTVYRIRSTEYSENASKHVVQKCLKEYLHTPENIDIVLRDTLEQLYKQGDESTQSVIYKALKNRERAEK